MAWERPCRGEICTELNVERYDLRRDGNVGFSHPYGTHDDVFLSIAPAVYATANMETRTHPNRYPQGITNIAHTHNQPKPRT